MEIAALARENDATVIGMTAKDSPLARECNLVLSMDVPEDTDVYMPMASASPSSPWWTCWRPVSPCAAA